MYSVRYNGQQMEAGTYLAVQRNSAYTRDPSQKIPKPLVIQVMINGHRAWALVDSGSLGDFMSSTLAEQLKLKKKELTTPLPVQLAVQGSFSKVNFGMTAKVEYQCIYCDWYFDIINLSNYDLILGTLFLHQNWVMMGINPPRLVIGSDIPLLIEGPGSPSQK